MDKFQEEINKKRKKLENEGYEKIMMMKDSARMIARKRKKEEKSESKSEIERWEEKFVE